jgi:oxygen-independent coproporphyrinogen-3 oxidase
MHRTHDAETALQAVKVLREEGIDNLSIDLIFATPATITREWERDLEITLGLELPHLSVYGLTVESHTPLGRWVARRDVSEAAEETFEGEYLLAHDRLTAAGFEHYEVSNYGKPGRHSRHNWAYWNRKAYGGIGPSAHEFDGAGRRWNASGYVEWVGRVTRGEDPSEGREELGKEQRMAEEVYLNLRTTAGTVISPPEREHIARLLDAGWAALTNDSTLRLTSAGWLRLDSIANNLTVLRSRS